MFICLVPVFTVTMIDLSFALSYLVGCDAVPHYELSILRGTDTQPGSVELIVIKKQTLRVGGKQQSFEVSVTNAIFLLILV